MSGRHFQETRPSFATILAALLLLAYGLSACSLPASEAPTPIDPTDTLGPILSPTPTAAIIIPPTRPPTITLTPTPSLTPSATPILYAYVRTQRDVTVYSGPSEEFIALALLLPAEQVILRGRDETGAWYFVQLGDGRSGWVASNFLQPETAPETAGEPLPTAPPEDGTLEVGTPPPIPPTATPYDLPIVEAPPVMPTAGLPPGSPSEVPDTPEAPRSSTVFALCDDPALGLPVPQDLSEGVLIVVWWAWLAQTTDQIQQHLDHVDYEISVDGTTLSNWADYQGNPIQEDGSWVVYWYVPYIRPLEAGEHRIEYRANWRSRIYDGIQYYGPGSATPTETGSCTFTVQEGA